MRRAYVMMGSALCVSTLLNSYGPAAHAAGARKYPYCGENFMIERSAEEAVQFIGQSPRLTYFVEIEEGVFTIMENPRSLPPGSKLTPMKQASGVAVSQLTRGGKTSGYLFEDRSGRSRTLITSESFKGGRRDFRALERFDFSPSRKNRCARVVVR